MQSLKHCEQALKFLATKERAHVPDAASRTKIIHDLTMLFKPLKALIQNRQLELVDKYFADFQNTVLSFQLDEINTFVLFLLGDDGHIIERIFMDGKSVLYFECRALLVLIVMR